MEQQLQLEVKKAELYDLFFDTALWRVLGQMHPSTQFVFVLVLLIWLNVFYRQFVTRRSAMDVVNDFWDAWVGPGSTPEPEFVEDVVDDPLSSNDYSKADEAPVNETSNTTLIEDDRGVSWVFSGTLSDLEGYKYSFRDLWDGKYSSTGQSCRMDDPEEAREFVLERGPIFDREQVYTKEVGINDGPAYKSCIATMLRPNFCTKADCSQCSLLRYYFSPDFNLDGACFSVGRIPPRNIS